MSYGRGGPGIGIPDWLKRIPERTGSGGARSGAGGDFTTRFAGIPVGGSPVQPMSDYFTPTIVPATHMDDRQIYVANAGSDTGNYGDAVGGGGTRGDINNPFQTLAYADNFLRDGFGDRLYLKKGDTFTGNFFPLALSGFSLTRPLMITSYGTGARPIINTNGNQFYQNSFHADVAHIWFIGLDITNTPYTGTGTHYHCIFFDWDCDDVLVENCYIHNFGGGVTFKGTAHDASAGRHSNMRIRGNVIADIYNTDTVGGDSQNCNGIFAQSVDTLIIEQNITINCGWVNPAHGTVYKHAIYVHAGGLVGDTGGCTGLQALNNFNYGGDGYTLRCGGIITGNFGAKSLSGIQAGMGDVAQVGGITTTFESNVVTQLTSFNGTAPIIAYALGNVGGVSTFRNNIASNCADNMAVVHTRVFWFRTPDDLIGSPVVIAAPVTFSGNKFYHSGCFDAGSYGAAAFTATCAMANNNVIFDANPFGDYVIFNSQAQLSTMTWAGNNMWASSGTNWFNIGGPTYPFSTPGANNDWLEKSGDLTGTSVNTTYVDPTRSVNSYAVALGLADEAALVAAARLRSFDNWNPGVGRDALTGNATCAYFRAGFV